MSRYDCIKPGPPVELTALMKGYETDSHQEKVNLSIKAYHCETGKPLVLPVVRQAEIAIAADCTQYKEYLPALGSPFFTSLATKLVLGNYSPALRDSRCFSVQTLSGTGGLRLGAEFLKRNLGYKTFYCAKQVLAAHKRVFIHAGFDDSREYHYWSNQMRGLNFKALMEDLMNAPENAVINFQVSGHNPTGCDPSKEQWEEILEVVRERKLFPFFFMSYQGLVSGDLDEDAYPVRLFVSKGIELFCSQSYDGNFGLYSERVGNLTIVASNQNCISNIQSQMTSLVRGMFSNPPCHGAKIIRYILSNATLFDEWKNSIISVSSRLAEMRRALQDALEYIDAPGDWTHLTTQTGMYSYTGLNRKQAIHMVKNNHVYMLRSGCINISGITHSNVDYIARAIKETLTNIK